MDHSILGGQLSVTSSLFSAMICTLLCKLYQFLHGKWQCQPSLKGIFKSTTNKILELNLNNYTVIYINLISNIYMYLPKFFTTLCLPYLAMFKSKNNKIMSNAGIFRTKTSSFEKKYPNKEIYTHYIINYFRYKICKTISNII